MSAVAAFWPETGRLRSVSRAFPTAIPILCERGLRDGVGRLYHRLRFKRGELVIQTRRRGGGRSAELTGASPSRTLRPHRRAWSADRWREAELAGRARQAHGVPPAAVRLEARGMGLSVTARPMFANSGGRCLEGRSCGRAESLTAARRRWPSARTVIRPGRQFAKLAKHNARWRTPSERARDDAAAAAILAVAEGVRTPLATSPAVALRRAGRVSLYSG